MIVVQERDRGMVFLPIFKNAFLLIYLFNELILPLNFVGDEFTAMQHSFFNQHCSLFDYGEENKLIYTDVFNRYVST